MIIHEMHYSNTNTYLIEGEKGMQIEESWNRLLGLKAPESVLRPRKNCSSRGVKEK